jgi:hypothetical protein
MIWLSAVSLVAGGLLARHFKIVVLVPATFVIVAIAIGELRTTGIWSILITIAVVSVGTQIGYFFGILIQYGLSALVMRRSPPSSDKRAERSRWIFRMPISR